MDQKFFLFKRKDPSVSGGAVFSDNGKGISVISLPVSNLAYMAAEKGAISLYFNNSAPFEENSLTLSNESFEKTSIKVSCEIGKEVEFMEAIIDFINRSTSVNIMRFDAIGDSSTFGKISPSPVIEAKVRARPVERGLVGTEAVVTGLDPNAVVNSIDFLKVENKPFVDYAAESITVAEGKLVLSLANSGTAGNDYPATSAAGTGFNGIPVCYGVDESCSEKSLSFNSPGALKSSYNFASVAVLNSPNLLDANLTDEPSVLAAVSGTLVAGTDYIAPTFKVSTDASANVTNLEVVNVGAGIKAGDIFLLAFESNGAVAFTVLEEHLQKEFYDCTLNFITSPPTPDIPFPLVDCVTYITVVIPNGALINPVYANNSGQSDPASLNEIYADQMGPFPFNSLGDEFEVSYGPTSPGYDIAPQTPSFKAIEPSFSYNSDINKSESSEGNLFSFVIRRTINREIFIYSRDGELIGNRSATDEELESKFNAKMFGLVLPFDISVPQLRMVRFGIIKKDIGDLMCRNIATQLYDHYKHQHV